MNIKIRLWREQPIEGETQPRKDSKGSSHMAESKGDEQLGVTYEGVLCYNRNKQGVCQAYKDPHCCEDCPARISNIDQKIELLESLRKYSRSRVDTGKLEEELREAWAVRDAKHAGRFDDWMSCYYEDRHRGSGGGGASESDANKSTGLKALMKDNRGIDTKPTKAEQAQYKEELAKWEEENGKLPKLARNSMSHSKVDSYLEEGE